MITNAEARLAEMGIEFPAAPAAIGAYIPVIRFGNTVVTSGQLPMQDGALMAVGKVGQDITVEEGVEAARIAVLNCLAQIRTCVDSLDEVTQIIRVEGFINSADGFHAQAQVMNGASRFLADVFGEAGRHTRIAVGVSELPMNAAVEVVVWAHVEDVVQF
ncbi:MAG: RidA family protein [Planctomycetota bacterium]|nr:RidA family protein [Planctomycetota bacterium]MDA1166423.1 RidA family protein [Planctomycetota bacterium]